MSMDLNKLPSNSNASKGVTRPSVPVKNPAPTEKKVEKVVSGKVKTKKNEIRKFTDIFVAEDIGSVKEYVVNDLLVPTVKNLFVDIVQNSVEMMILGGRRGGSSRRSNTDRVSYRDYGSYSRDDRDRSRSTRSRSTFDYDDIVFETKRDAEAVLDELDRIIDSYGFAKVSDLYDMCELSAPYTANSYGWTSISRARVASVRGGYILEMPRASAID